MNSGMGEKASPITAVPAGRDVRALPLTREQADLLLQTEAAFTQAKARRDLVAATIVAGHGLREATLLRVEGDPPTLIVECRNGSPDV